MLLVKLNYRGSLDRLSETALFFRVLKFFWQSGVFFGNRAFFFINRAFFVSLGHFFWQSGIFFWHLGNFFLTIGRFFGQSVETSTVIQFCQSHQRLIFCLGFSFDQQHKPWFLIFYFCERFSFKRLKHKFVTNFFTQRLAGIPKTWKLTYPTGCNNRLS